MTCTGFALIFVHLTCQQPAATAGATFCATAKPILWSKTDSRKTKEMADAHNRVGRRLCGWGGKK